jgi:hypothetical protein
MTRHVAARGAIGRVAESRLSPSDGPRGRARRAAPGLQALSDGESSRPTKPGGEPRRRWATKTQTRRLADAEAPVSKAVSSSLRRSSTCRGASFGRRGVRAPTRPEKILRGDCPRKTTAGDRALSIDPTPGPFLEALGRVASLRLGGVAPLFEAFVADGEALEGYLASGGGVPTGAELGARSRRQLPPTHRRRGRREGARKAAPQR